MSIGIKKILSRNVQNILGWQTARKIVVIESDDWGTIRMSSKQSFNYFLQKGYPVDQCAYNSNDALESNADFEYLYEVLNSVKDKNNNPAIITTNNIVANPDFERIKKSGFCEYFYEPFTDTLKRYPKHDKVIELYKEGISKRFIKPQFHGREHLNVNRWMKALRNGIPSVLDSFDQGMFSVHAEQNPVYRNEYMDALDMDNLSELEMQKQMLSDGLRLFKDLWGFQSRSFIAPCYIWHSKLEQHLSNNGVYYLQGLINQLEPLKGIEKKFKKKLHYQGEANSFGQKYLVRNVFFEPSGRPDYNWIDDCINRISIAFRWRKPAIISSHRVNYIGFLNTVNREKNLVLLNQLLKAIIKKWPDAEFLASDELGDIMNK